MQVDSRLKVLLFENNNSTRPTFNKNVSEWSFKIKKIRFSGELNKTLLPKNIEVFDSILIYTNNAGSVVKFLKSAKEFNHFPPLLIISNKDNEKETARLIKAGANDVFITDDPNKDMIGRWMYNAVRLWQTKKKLEWSEERYLMVGRATNDMVWDWDLQSGTVFRSEEGWKAITGGSTVSRSANGWWHRIHAQDKKNLRQILEKILADKRVNKFGVSYRIRRDDGLIAYIEEKGYVIRNEKGNAIRITGVTRNQTEKMALEEKLAFERINSQNEITRAVIYAQEKEREAIGKELHDNINQILATTRLYIEYAMENPENSHEFLDNSRRFIASAVEEIRKLSRSLMPPSLEHVGLKMAVNDLVESIAVLKKFKIRTSLNELDEKHLSESLKLTIFRIIQEQLTNILKHASAKNVLLKIKSHPHRLILEIKDDGRGFNAEKVKEGLGFKNISNRALLHRGHLTLQTAPKKGCLVCVEFELS